MRTIGMDGNRRPARANAPTRARAQGINLATLALGAALLALLALLAPVAQAQGSRKDDIVFGPGGHPVAGATVTVCQASATGTPCTPLATIYTDATLTVPAANPLQTDGIGNYHFYAPAGRYLVQISGPGISGTLTYRDVILAPDVSSSGSGNNISAFGLTLGGNLSVAGNAAVNGALAVGGSTTYTGPLNINAANTGNVAAKSTSADAVQYVTPEGNDANDGLSWGTAKYTVFAACEALPGGAASPATCGHGTVYFTDASHANPTAGAGFWLLGFSDPNYATPPAGWLRFVGGSALDLIGIATKGNGPNGHIGKAWLQGGSGADRNHPGVWLSGFGGAVRIANLNIQYPGRAYVVGECSDNTRSTACGVSGVTLENTTGNLNAVAGNGPCFDLTGASFWIFLRDWGCGGADNVNAPADDKSASLLIDGRGNSGLGLIFIKDANTSNGGIKDYAGTNINQFDVDGLTTEAQQGEPAVWIAKSGNSGDSGTMANIFNVQVADDINNSPAIQNDIPGTGPQVLVSNAQLGPVVGPATVLNQYGATLQPQTVSPLRNGQTGFFNGHLFGATDLTARMFAPVGVRFTNLAKTDATTWTNSGSTTFTTGITAPDGTTGAGQFVSTSGIQAGYLRPQTSMTLSAGDYFVAGAWVRSQTANGYSQNGMPIQIVNLGGTSTCVNNSWVVAGDGQWDWVTMVCKILTAPSNPYFVGLNVNYDATHAIQAYGPVLVYIPAGTISENEVYAYAAALAPYDKNCAVGTMCGLATQLFNPIGGAIFNGTGTPLASTPPPYTPACLAATTCGSFLALSDLVADSFTRANASSLGANWTTMGGYNSSSIVSNSAVNNSAGSNLSFSYYNAQALSADQFSQATLSASPTNYAGVGVRVAAGDNGYWFYCTTGTSYMLKRVSGAQTILTSAFTTCTAGDVMRIEAGGTQITAYKNGAQVSTASDSSLTNGTAGIELYNSGSSNNAFQNFVGGNLKPGYNQPGYWAKMQTFGPGVTVPETTAPSASAGNDVCYGDSTAHAVKCSYNNGSFLNVPQVIASGTSALGTGAISATSCATVVTTAATGAATTDAISWSFNAAPGTGYASGLHVLPYVTSGNVNFLVCNPTAGSLTPAAATLNWRVLR